MLKTNNQWHKDMLRYDLHTKELCPRFAVRSAMVHACFINIILAYFTGTGHYCAVMMGAMTYRITSLTIVCSTVFFRWRSRKSSKLRVTGFGEGNSPVTGEFPAQRASNAENVFIWWRHRGQSYDFWNILVNMSHESRKHDDVITWRGFPSYWPLVRGIHLSPVDSPKKRPVAWSFDDFFDIHMKKNGQTVESPVIWIAVAIIWRHRMIKWFNKTKRSTNVPFTYIFHIETTL